MSLIGEWYQTAYGLAVRWHVRRYGPPRSSWTLDDVIEHCGFTRADLWYVPTAEMRGVQIHAVSADGSTFEELGGVVCRRDCEVLGGPEECRCIDLPTVSP